MAELGNKGFQIFSSLLGRMDVSEEIPQSVGEKLVTEVMELHQLIQDIPSAHTETHSHRKAYRYYLYLFNPYLSH